MAGDKKAEAGGVTLILARRIGDAFVQRYDHTAPILDFLKSEGAA